MPVTEHEQAAKDGNIQAARTRLVDAINALIDPVPTGLWRDSTGPEVRMLDSLYTQLRDSTGGQNVSEKGDSRQARMPIWADAVDLLREIDVTAAVWSRIQRPGPATTVARLEAIANSTWRPQDTDRISRWASDARGWADRIKRLLDPESVKTISAPCPACNQKTVYRRDSTGDMVRQPALQLVASRGCVCLACHTSWSPDLYLHLVNVLGFEKPNGVLE